MYYYVVKVKVYANHIQASYVKLYETDRTL